MATHLGRGRRARVVLAGVETAPARGDEQRGWRHSASSISALCATSSTRTRSTPWSRRRLLGSDASTGSSTTRRRFRPMAPIADVDESDVDVFYTSGVKGTLWGHASGVPAHEATTVGPHRELRVVDGPSLAAAGSPRTTHRRKPFARSRAPRRGEMGRRRHHRERDRARRRDASRRRGHKERGLPHLHRELPDGTPRAIPNSTSRRSRGSFCSDACPFT